MSLRNCMLPEEADHQLHVVLEQILDGIAVMKADKGRAYGAVKIVQALELMAHASIKPLEAVEYYAKRAH